MEKKHTAAKLHRDPLFLHDIFICAGFAFISGNPETLHQKIQLLLVCIFFSFYTLGSFPGRVRFSLVNHSETLIIHFTKGSTKIILS